jgi:type VI secretion system protein ImpF
MPRAKADQPLVPSLLDRLLDDDPAATRDAPRARSQVLSELKQSVRRDLENLLNSRWRCEALPDDQDELPLSLVNYGIPDITGASLGSAANREQFRQVIERVIRHFEPRFQQVTVEMLENAEPLDRALRFRIEALLYAEPAPEPVVFDSALQPATGNVEVKGPGR